jgi:hypothetical protein
VAYAKGLTNDTELAFGRDGSLYAVQIATNGLLKGPKGSLVKVSHTGGKPTVIAGNLPSPYGVAVQGRSAYVSTCSICAGAARCCAFRRPETAPITPGGGWLAPAARRPVP